MNHIIVAALAIVGVVMLCSFHLTGDAFVAVFGVTVVLVWVGLVLRVGVRG